jgi:hypothetical protein
MAKQQEEAVKEVRIKPKLENYTNGVSGSGKRTKNCGDDIAQALDGFTLEEVQKVASQMRDIPVKDLSEKYAHLNIGQQRMNLGNLIRGAVAKLDKAHDKDKAVVPGLKTLQVQCGAFAGAVAKRQKAAATAKADREAKAAENAKAKAAKEKATAKKAA